MKRALILVIVACPVFAQNANPKAPESTAAVRINVHEARDVAYCKAVTRDGLFHGCKLLPGANLDDLVNGIREDLNKPLTAESPASLRFPTCAVTTHSLDATNPAADYPRAKLR